MLWQERRLLKRTTIRNGLHLHREMLEGLNKEAARVATNKRRVLGLPATFDNNVMGLIPSEFLLSEYLFSFMQSFDLAELQAGTSVPAISQGKDEAMKPPPLAEHRQIAAELDELQAEVDVLKRLQAETATELDALLPSIFGSRLPR